MNYFPFHIGDFDRATRHLTRIERSIYIDLLFMYYDTERALVKDLPTLCRKVVARTEEEKEAVTAILSEFFIDTPSGWFHERCEEVLAEYRNTKTQASEAGKASARARAERRAAALAAAKAATGVEQKPTDVEQKGNENPTTVERPLNDRATDAQRDGNEQATGGQPTNNQEPKPITRTRKNKSAPPGGDADLFPDVDPKVVEDFKVIRKAKRAPVTPTAMADITAEAAKAGLTLEGALRICCARGWQGFRADWIQNDRRQGVGQGRANGSGQGTKFNLAGIDHSSTRAAAEASREKHGIVIPDDDDDIKF